MRFKIKRKLMIVGILLCFCAYFLLAFFDIFNDVYVNEETEPVVEKRLLEIEQHLKNNQLQLNQMGSIIRSFVKEYNFRQIQSNRSNSRSVDLNDVVLRNNDCLEIPHQVVNSDIDMTKVYRKLSFDNPSGGAWQQGFPIETSDAEWEGKKLKVFVVPHSHNDPGWLNTVDEYFQGSTRFILDNVVDALSQQPNRRFIWSEMSYLSMWWNVATPHRKAAMKKLVDNGQLEMVTAGWVMNDEANTHYFSMIDQMIEGNEWLSRNLGVIPKNGWAIDPFGHSPTMAYLLKKMNFDNMLIQRVHYAIKKHLASERSLEFRWRQSWSRDVETDILCHLMPFAAYSVSYTCGPDPKICCMFDFQKTLPNTRSCPNGPNPEPITDGNVAAKSVLLLDQYRKKSKLFQTNTLLVVLGDDFRYNSVQETKAHFENYEKIFTYVRSHPEMNAELKFGTLKEYFHAVGREIGNINNFPTLTGDFFTYADKDDDYWSGYYVSRPFYKTQDRVLGSQLRGAEILFSLAFPVANAGGIRTEFSKLYRLLVEARQNLGLFQHHDGITGTARDHVVMDYGTKLMRSITATQKVQALSAQILLSRDLSTFKADVLNFDFDEIYTKQNDSPEKRVINLVDDGSFKFLVIYNSLAYDRKGVVNIFVSTSNIEIVSLNDQILLCQTNPIWKDETSFETDKYQVQFQTTVPATGLITYKLKYSSKNFNNILSTTNIYNAQKQILDPSVVKSPFLVVHSIAKRCLILKNDHVEVQFSRQTGLLQYVLDKFSGIGTKVVLNFVYYKSYGGAYLFRPYGGARQHIPSKYQPVIRLITGPLSSEIQVSLPNILHRVTLYKENNQGIHSLGIHIRNEVDIRTGSDNKEIAMRLSSDIDSGAKFYTDLNGFQMQQRTYYDKLPLQANFYPMPTMAYIQDRYKRLSLITGQPLGVSSIKEGQLEVIIERRLKWDDSRGLGQGIKDNVPTIESFVIFLEYWNRQNLKKIYSDLSYPSLVAHRMSWELLHRLVVLSEKPGLSKNTFKILPRFKPLFQSNWPCDIHLLNLRAIQSRDQVQTTGQSAMILHRVGKECLLDSDRYIVSTCSSNNRQLNYNVLVSSFYKVDHIIMTSLSLQENGKKLDYNSTVTIKPMEIEAFKVTLI